MRLSPAIVSTQPTAAERAVVAGFGATELMQHVRGMGGPRVAGSAEAKRAAEYIRDTALANGWTATIEEARSGSRTLYNVVAERAGSAPASERKLVLAGAHLDSVPGAYGANDDASGSAALLEGTRVFASIPTKHDLRFVWFDGEEQGLLGSRAYATRHADELRHASAMVVAEMLGSPTGTPALVFTDRSTSTKVGAVTTSSASFGIAPRMVVDPMAGSDHQPFARIGIPSFVVASATPRTMGGEDPNYHRPTDTPDKLNPAVYETSADLFGLAVNAFANA